MDMDIDTGGRWVQAQGEDSGIVWCDSAEAVLQAVNDGHTDIEIGAAEPTPVLEAIGRVALHLRSLSLTGCNLEAATLMQLGTILAPTQIQGIGVSNNPGVDIVAWADFWGKLPCTIVKYDFGDDQLVDEALPHLVRTLSRGRVEEVFLDGNCFENISPLLPIVSESFGLTELDLGDNNIEDSQVLALAQLLPASVVTTLVLGRNNISDASAVVLAGVLPRTKVKILHLDSTQIGDATLDALACVLAGSRLTELHVDETQVTDASVLRFCRAMPTSRITVFDASDNNLSDESIAAIEAAVGEDTTME